MPLKIESLYRLFIILFVFPIFWVYGVPILADNVIFFNGVKTLSQDFWYLAAFTEWTILALVVISLKPLRDALIGYGVPLDMSKKDKTLFLSLLFIFIVLAFYGAGTSQEFLNSWPQSRAKLIPASDLDTRLFWVFMSLTAAIVEETIFRGVAQKELKKLLNNQLLAVLISGFAFAFFHGGFSQGTVAFMSRFMVAIVFSFIAIKTKSLKWPMILHFIGDAVLLGVIQID